MKRTVAGVLLTSRGPQYWEGTLPNGASVTITRAKVTSEVWVRPRMQWKWWTRRDTGHASTLRVAVLAAKSRSAS